MFADRNFCSSDTTVYSGKVSHNPNPSEDINFQWGVPENTIRSGSGNVYFQLNASTDYSWVALGIGTGMEGAGIFLLYPDGDGNITLSTRAGEYHVMPEYTERPKTSLMEGSGIVDGRIVANIRCGDCDSLNLEGENTWIAAWLHGEPLNSRELDERITFHGRGGKQVFDVDFAQARISSDSNPFLVDSREGTSDDAAVTVKGAGSEHNAYLIAHGTIMTIVFVGLYPLGALLMPVFGKWFLHSTSQLLAYLLMWVGFALGVVYALKIDFVSTRNELLLHYLLIMII